MEVPLRTMQCVLLAVACTSGVCCSETCHESSHTSNDLHDTLPAKTKLAVQEYLNANPGINGNLKKAILSIPWDKPTAISNGNLVMGDWTLSVNQSRLWGHDYWIGNEHMWYEIRLGITNDQVSVSEVVRNSERIREE